jgi:ABC-2 type transport system ATP-binding protein
MDDIAVRVDGISKTFKLPHERQTSVKGALINFHKHRSYEKQRVLKNVSFEVKKGEFFGIVGRNGSGKSTLLKILAGIYAPSKGGVKINGSLVPFIELGVGFNPELTGRENVFLNGALLGFNRRQMRAMYDEIVEFAELEKFMDQKLKNYSSGMQVRLAFSIAIQAHGDILLLDEVLAVGDALFQKKCFEYFAQLKQDKKTVILVSHDTEALLRFCDRGVFISNGKIVKNDDIEKVVDVYKLQLMDDDSKVKDKNTNKSGKFEETHKIQRKARIISCASYNERGPTAAFSYREDIYIDVGVKIREGTSLLNIAVGIYNGAYEAHADRVFGSNTQLEKIHISPKTKKVRLAIKAPELRNGEYIAYVVIFGQTESVPYDYRPQAVKFIVEGAPKLKSTGVLMAEHSWNDK